MHTFVFLDFEAFNFQDSKIDFENKKGSKIEGWNFPHSPCYDRKHTILRKNSFLNKHKRRKMSSHKFPGDQWEVSPLQVK